MSAVMSTLSVMGGGRRAHRKISSTSGRKSGQHSDAGEDRSGAHEGLKQQRSASLQTLEMTATTNGGVGNLDTLEAKMASIEVSLVGPRRRSAGCGREGREGREGPARELDALRTALKDKDSLIQSLKRQLSASLSAARLAACPGAGESGGEERGRGNDGGVTLGPDERRALVERAAAVRSELEVRRGNMAELRRRLERTHVTENIDTRIQQAELQYKLGREELELLTLGEQARVLAALIQRADAVTAERERASLYSLVRECGGAGWLVACELRAGTWTAAAADGLGLRVTWARDPGTLTTGDRLVEVNGVSLVSGRSQEDLQRVLSEASAPTPARVVVLRTHPTSHAAPTSKLTQNEVTTLRAELGATRAAADQAERGKQELRGDNTRLTHRISYLEEQVSELLASHGQLPSSISNEGCLKSTVNKCKKNVTNINITSESSSNNKSTSKSEVQVFQKGPDITAIVAKLPGLEAEANLPILRPRSNASGASSKMGISPRASPAPRHRSHSSHSLEHRTARMRHSQSQHCVNGGLDYHTETDAAIRLIERNQRQLEKQRNKSENLSRCTSDDHFKSDSDMELKDTHENRHVEIKKAADRIEESIKKTNWAERKTLSIIEQLKRSQRLRKMKKNDSAEDIKVESEKNYMYNRIDGKVLENAHKSSRRFSKLYTRSAKSSEFESECSDYPNGDMYSSSPRISYGSEVGSTRLIHYRKHDDRPDGEAKSRPIPPRKPLRLSLHKAKSAHSLINGSESETPGSPRPPSEYVSDEVYKDTPSKRPVKRTHASEKWSRERLRESGKATPRPSRKLMNGFRACETAAADDFYPENTQSSLKANGVIHRSSAKWC